jgi:hypothetical protein
MLEQEFNKENIKKGLYRTFRDMFAFVMFFVGFLLCEVNQFLGLGIIAIGLGIIAKSIYQSTQDKIAIKWFNVIFKIIIFLVGLGLAALAIFLINFNS